MAFHMAAYSVALGTTDNTDIPAVTDDELVIQNGHFLLQTNRNLLFAAASGATLDRVRIVSPSNRQVSLPFIRPINSAAQPGSDPNIADYRENPFQLAGLEELAMEGTSDISSGTERTSVLIGIQNVAEAMPAGNIFTMRGTSTTASVANAWTTVATTWADILPNGTFAVVGLSSVAATGVAARILFEGMSDRPGGITNLVDGGKTNPMFLKGGLGVWGRFRSTALPQIQVFNTAAVSVHTFYMDIIRLS